MCKFNMFRTLKAEEIECRVGMCRQNGLTILLYQTARAAMDLLDETVGPMNWKKEYFRDNRNCTISVWDDKKSQWISKEDTGTESNTEAEKGLASDAMKRAAVNWGIGRELYTAPFIWIPAGIANIQQRGTSYTCSDHFDVAEIEYDGDRRISYLVITKKGQVVYTFGKKADEQEVQDARKELKRKLASAGITPDTLMALYKVRTVDEMTPAKVDNALKNVDKIKARQDMAA